MEKAEALSEKSVADTIGKAAATRKFSRKLDVELSETTVRSIRDGYLEEMRRQRQTGETEQPWKFPERQRGRPLLLGDCLEEKLQMYIKRVREEGGVVSSKIVMAAARGMLLSYDRSKLAENGGHICLNRHWAYSFLRRMSFVQRKATTSLSKYSVSDFAEVKKSFLASVVETVNMEEIPPELILNWDQTGIMIVPSASWAMDERGTRRVEIGRLKDKRQITAVFCGSIQGDFLPVQLIYKGTTQRCHPHFKFPPGWHVTHSKNHWSTETTMLEYIDNIIVPYISANRENDDQSALVIMDNFKGQVAPSIVSMLEENNIQVCLLPPNTTDRLQPLDISVNKPAKHFLQQKFQEWYSDQILQQLDNASSMEDVELEPIDLSLPVMRELGANWLVDMAKYIADNPDFIVNGFVRAGISEALDGVENENDYTCYSESSEELPVSDEETLSDHDVETESVIILSDSD